MGWETDATIISIIAIIVVVLSKAPKWSNDRAKERWENIGKPRSQAIQETSRVRRELYHENLVKSHWLPRIMKLDKKVARATTRSANAFRSGNVSNTHLKSADRPAKKASGLRALMYRELDITQRMHSASERHPSVPKINPKTGHITGGIGRSGYKPSHSNPRVRTPRKTLKDHIIGNVGKKK